MSAGAFRAACTGTAVLLMDSMNRMADAGRILECNEVGKSFLTVCGGQVESIAAISGHALEMHRFYAKGSRGTHTIMRVQSGAEACSHSPDVAMSPLGDDMSTPICVPGSGRKTLLTMVVWGVSLVLLCAGTALVVAPGDASPCVVLICACAEWHVSPTRSIMISPMARVTGCDNGVLAGRVPPYCQSLTGLGHSWC